MTAFSALVDLTSNAAFAVDANSRIVSCNSRLSGLLGYATEEAVGCACYEVLRATLPNGAPLCSPACEGRYCFEHHAPFAVQECSLRRKDGRRFKVAISTLVAPASPDSAASDAAAIIFLHRRGEEVRDATADGKLRVCTLGSFGLSLGGHGLATERWHRKQALTLLKVLVTRRGEAVCREHLIECLWPDADERRGRERLKVTTYFLRQQLRAGGLSGHAVRVTGAGYALNWDAIWLDFEAFERFFEEGRQLQQRGRVKEALARFEEAERLYTGDYLPDDGYADWCAAERQRLRETYLDLLSSMVDCCLDMGDHARAADACRRGLVHEPYREGFHRGLMICLTRLGKRDRAVAHYHRCRRVLETELGVEPTPETERVYREVVLGRARERSSGRMRR
jgi:DNA-binding SARP family transcriptional activator